MVSIVQEKIEKRRGNPVLPYKRWVLAKQKAKLYLKETTSFESIDISTNYSLLAWQRF